MTTLADLVVQETKAAIYGVALSVATALGLPVTSWETGDPTRSLYHHLSEILSGWEVRAAGYVASGFLDLCAADDTLYDWLVLLAEQVYGYAASEATNSTCTVRLSNAGGGYYPIGVGEVTFKDSTTGVTFHNTTAGLLDSGPGTTLDLDFVCDTAGSDGSSAIGDVDTMVTTLLDVTCTNTTAAVGVDEEPASSIVDGCRAKLGALSPNGPADAYNSVVRNSTLTGTTGITRSRTIADSTTGVVTVYVAGPSGAVSGPDLVLAQSAIEQWATPLCITPTATNCANLTIAVTYSLTLYSSVGKSDTEAKAEVAAAILAALKTRPIGGDIIPPATTGKLYHAWLLSVIRGVYPDHAFLATLTAPAGDTSMALNQVATLGVVTPTVTFVADP